MKLHTAALEVLNEMVGSSKQLIEDITRIRVNFSIVENVKNDYAIHMKELTGIKDQIRKLINLHNIAKIPAEKTLILNGLKQIMSIAKVLLMNKVWESSSAFAISQGQKVFSKSLHPDPLLNFLYHKHPSPDAYTDTMIQEDSDPERPFDVTVKLVTELRKLTENTTNLLN